MDKDMPRQFYRHRNGGSAAVLLLTLFCFQINLGKTGTIDLELAAGVKRIVKLEYDGVYTIGVDYTTTVSDNYTLKANFDSGFSFTGTIDEVAKNGSIIIDSSKLGETYGTHVVSLKMVSNTGKTSDVRKVVMYFEEPIENFKVTNSYYVKVNSSVRFICKMDLGSNIDLENIVNGKASVTSHSGKVRSVSKYHSFPTAARNWITAVASNTITRAVVTKTVMSVYEAQDFWIENDFGPDETMENVYFKFFLKPTMNLTMGPLTLYIDFDDGTTDTKTITDLLDTFRNSSGFVVSHRYTFQGNYTVKSEIQSKINTVYLENKNVFVWNNLTNATLSANIINAKVQEVVSFSFPNPPAHGFLYKVNYGDGYEDTNNETSFYNYFVDPKLTHSYSQPGVYHVTMTAWNVFYFSRKHLDIYVQIPIPVDSIYLTPSQDEIPIPGAYKTYIMKHRGSEPSPTNVTCNFNSGEILEKNIPTDINSTAPIIKDYTYKRPGTKRVVFTCANLVSTMTKTATLFVKSFTAKDFQIHYQDKVNMNMTKVDGLNGGAPTFSSDNVTVVFHISLFAVTHLPPNITFSWDFGDGLPVDKFILSSYSHSHTFIDRGTYTMKLNISWTKDYHVHIHTIQLGVLLFSMKSYKGVINVTEFEFIAEGIGSGAKYTFNTDYDNVELHSTAVVDRVKQHFTYRRVGSYYPVVVGTNDTFYEKVYLDDTLFVDWSIKGIRVVFSNTSIHLPPGNLTMNVTLPALSKTDTHLTCIVNFGDKIDWKNYTFHHNITVDDPFIYEYFYLTLGTHILYIRCFNLIEVFENSTIVELVNPCFVERGIYDRQYSNPETPMLLYTLVDTDLSSRMPVKCFWLEPQYFWEIYSHKNGIERKIDYKWYTIPSGTFRFWKGTIDPGVYKVSLKVALTGTWCYEYTYVKFERSPPFSQIAIGNRRYAKRSILEVDALSQSYNPEGGPGDNKQLTFDWYCYRFNSTHKGKMDIEELFISRGGIQYFLNNSYYAGNDTIPADQPCGDLMEIRSPGIARIRANNFDFDDYIVVVEVGLEHAEPSYDYQMITMVPGEPPNVEFRCLINCRKKVASSELIAWEASCSDCMEFELRYTQYSWSLSEYDRSKGTYKDVPYREAMFLTDVEHQELGIRAKILKPGTKYRLNVKVAVRGRNDVGKGEILLETNYLPYDGSCGIDPKKGNATTTIFKVTCIGWKDEGSRKSQKASIDGLEPLTYRYMLEIPRIVNGSAIEEIIPIFVAGERTLSELMLPLGDKNYDYGMTVVVKICDVYGDCAVNKDAKVTVTADESMIVDGTQNGMDGLFGSYNVTLKELQAGGNIIAVIRYVGATASMISDVNVTEAEDGVRNDLVDKNYQFMNIFYDAVSDERSNNTKDRMNAGDSANVVKNVLAAMKNDGLMNDNSTGLAVKTARFLTRNMNDLTDSELFPVEDLDFISQTSDAALTIVDTALNTVLPDEITDWTEVLVREDIEAELRSNRTFETPEEEEAFQEEVTKEMAIRQAKIDYMKNKVEHGEDTVPQMIAAVESMQGIHGSKMIPHEDEGVVERPNVRITVEKTSMEMFMNRTDIDKQDFKMQFSNQTNMTSTVSLRTAVFKKTPYFYGKGAKSLTSKGVMVTVMNGTRKENISLTLKLKNEGTASFRKVVPEYIPGDPTNRLYFKCNLSDTNDAMLIYVKPDDFDPDDYSSFGLYDVSITEPAYKWSTSHKFVHPLEIRDWVNSDLGLKVFVPQGLFPAGELYVVLKPVEPQPIVDIPKGYRRRLLGINSTSEPNTTENPIANSTITPYDSREANVSIIISTTGCRTWNEERKEWTSSGCEVLDFSDLNETACRCPEPQGDMFATTFYVPPNTIDFSAVFSKFDWTNAVVYGTCIGIICVYALLCLWARRQDPKDCKRWATHFLCDSDKDDIYFYLMTVKTGMRKGAGSKSSFNFVLSGDEADTDVRILSDGITQVWDSSFVTGPDQVLILLCLYSALLPLWHVIVTFLFHFCQEQKEDCPWKFEPACRDGFPTGSNRTFIMGTPVPLGELLHLRIWQDCRGEGSFESWFLDQIIVDDPQTNDRYVFVCNNWISTDRGERERELTVTDRGSMRNFQNRFSQEARFSLAENHLWLSLVFRPNKSNFNRVQRMSCVLALLFLTMITNAMFYQTESEEVEADVITLGSLKFSLKTFYVSLLSILITTPPILLIAYIFKNSKLKVTKEPKTEKDIVDETLEKRVRNVFSYHSNANKNIELVDSDLYSQDHLPLPHWTIYIAWLIVFLTVATSSFFLILYSMEWGKTKSEEWMSSFVLSFFESLFVMDPVKVILIAVLVAWLFKRPAGAGAPNVKLDKVRELVQHFNAGPLRSYLTFRRNVLTENVDVSTEEIKKVKLKRQQEMKANEALMEIIVYIIFIFIMYSLGYINRDERSYLLKQNIERSLYDNASYQFGFQGVQSYENYMLWLRKTLFERYFPEEDYSGQRLGVRDRMFFFDLDNARIGPARLRQVRMHKEKCPYDKLTRSRYCVPIYSDDEEETDSFCVGWQPYNKTCATNRFLYSEDAWVFRTSEEIWGISMVGDYGSYGGGGYILKLDISLENSLNILNELERYKWIDRRTRGVFVEFTLYNANTNLFAYIVFLCEFTPLGGLTTWTDIRSFRPYQHTGAVGAFAILCYIIYMIMLLVDTVKCFIKIRKQGCRYLTSLWQIVDLLCAILSYVAIAFWVLRYKYAKESMAIYYNDKKAFITFQHVVVWDYAFSSILGILIFIATIRILKILGYNKRMTELSDVIANAAKDLGGFFFCFSLVFFSFVSLGHLLFGTSIKKYRSLFSTIGSLSNSLIGKNSLDSLIRAAPQVSQFYYFMYVLFVILMLMTMFAAILNQSISEVREEIQKDPETFGIMNVITDSVKDVLGSFINFKKKTDNLKEENVRRQKFLQPDDGGFTTPNVLKLVRESFGREQEETDPTPLPFNKNKLQALEAVAMLDIAFTVRSPTGLGGSNFGSGIDIQNSAPINIGIENYLSSGASKIGIVDIEEENANGDKENITENNGQPHLYMPYL